LENQELVVPVGKRERNCRKVRNECYRSDDEDAAIPDEIIFLLRHQFSIPVQGKKIAERLQEEEISSSKTPSAVRMENALPLFRSFQSVKVVEIPQPSGWTKAVV
jgi:hypothetical protein